MKSYMKLEGVLKWITDNHGPMLALLIEHSCTYHHVINDEDYILTNDVREILPSEIMGKLEVEVYQHLTDDRTRLRCNRVPMSEILKPVWTYPHTNR